MAQADGGGCLVGPKAQNRMGAVTAKQAAIALVVAAAFCCAAVVTLVEHSVYTINSVGSERGAALISQRIRRTTSGGDDGETFVDGDGLAVADSADVWGNGMLDGNSSRLVFSVLPSSSSSSSSSSFFLI